jgi:murein DD-endopeptidase MepM/ murein hydrolase activator NlpD
MTRAASYTIIWTPKNIQLTLGLGDIRDIAASFVSNTNMSNVDLWVVPELQPFVRLAPNHFDTVVAGSSYSVSIHFSVPLGTETRLYDGTIHARVGSATYPQTLKINLNIVEAAITIGPEGGSVIVPDASVSATIPVGALSENTLITIKQTGEQGPVGNIYEFGPTGLSFSSPITISIGFNQTILPQNVDVGDLYLATECDGGYIEPLENISVDTFNKRVIGQTWHFSDVWITHGILVVDANNNPILSQNIPLATSFRMPIGDLRDFRTTPITCHDGLSYSSEDLGNDISLLTIGTYANNYPKIEFNSGVAENLNRWIVSVAFNKNQQLASYATGELASYGVFHPGEDWNRRLGGSSDDGRPIHAIADGLILYSQTQTSTISKRTDGTAGFGNIVVIGHKLNDGSILASVYAHKRALSPCSVGEHINKGDIIGLIGDTGSIYADGTPIPNNHHLHFEIIKTTIASSASSKVWQIDTPVIDKISDRIYIRYSNNSGWYWPKTEQKIFANYSFPSVFIKNYSSIPCQQYQFQLKWGTYGPGDGQFLGAIRLAVDKNGYIYVVDPQSHRIQKFDPNGNFITKWGTSGSGDGQFMYPTGIAISTDDKVYVADGDNFRIQKFDINGNFIMKWGSNGWGDGQFRSPVAIAIDPSGNVYVADFSISRIQKFDSNGNFITKWGSRGSGDGQFNLPVDLTIDDNGYIYVAESMNCRVQKFDLNGNFIKKWGSSGYGDGQFREAWGIAVDSNCDVFVSDFSNSRIQKFDSNGNFIAKWGSRGSGDGQFYFPMGIAIDLIGNVYVADPYYYRIQKFVCKQP